MRLCPCHQKPVKPGIYCQVTDKKLEKSKTVLSANHDEKAITMRGDLSNDL